MNVDLNLYKIFYVVGKYRSFTKAAKELYLSQPAISKSVKKLETSLNTKLFEKGGKGIVLTEAGLVVYEYAERICRLDVAGNELIKQIKQGQNKILRIGVPTHIGAFYLSKFIATFIKQNPNIQVQIINKHSEEMITLLENRKLDIVVDTDVKSICNDSLNLFQLLNLEGCFVYSPKYRCLKNASNISIEELVKHPLLLPSKSTANRKMIDMMFNKQNIDVYPLVEVNSSSIAKEIIKQGNVIGWMIKELVQEDIDKDLMRELTVNIPSVLTSIDVVYNKTFINENTKKFIRILKERSNR